MSLDPAVEAQLNSGHIARLDMIRFDLPGKVVGYHRGGRPYTYNGLTYFPNRYLSFGSATAAVGVSVTTRTLTFSNVPTDNPDDAIAHIESYNYLNAPVIISHLAGVPNTSEVLGVLFSSIYEIDSVRFKKGAMQSDGSRSLTLEIDIQPPGRSARGSTLARRSQTEQQYDNLATDTCLEYASVIATDTMEWGQR